jgi:glucose-1-phosphate thymidylyltransferase
MHSNKLTTRILERGTTWLDTGTCESLHATSSYVEIIEKRQGSKIPCLEEIARRNKWIDDDELKEIAPAFNENSYGIYLNNLLL